MNAVDRDKRSIVDHCRRAIARSLERGRGLDADYSYTRSGISAEAGCF
jgi:hypothetical protein